MADFANRFLGASPISATSNTVLRNSIGGRVSGRKDKFDFLQFTLTGRSLLSINLTKLKRNADVTLFNSSREVLVQSSRSNRKPERLKPSLEAGTYYLKIAGLEGRTKYKLQLEFQTNPPPPLKPPYNPKFGYGEVNAAAAVAWALNQPLPFPEVPEGLTPEEWGIDRVKAPEVWAQGFTGTGVVVAVIDSGINYFNNFLIDSIWRNSDEIPENFIDDDGNQYIDDDYGWDFVYNDNSPFDIDGHGTFIAGIITDRDVGIAPDARVMAVKVSDPIPTPDAEIAAGIRYAVDNGADIINISIGGPQPPTVPLQQAIQYAYNQGVLVIASAGNDGELGATVPDHPALFAAREGYGMAIGAIDQKGEWVDFSNPAGNRPLNYLVAPGADVYSTALSNSSFYDQQSGTSFSAPAVAAVAALMLSANPQLTPLQIMDILMTTSSPLS